MKRVLFISNIPTIYRVDLYNLLTNCDEVDSHFLFIPNKKIKYKESIWGNNDNDFFKKSYFISEKFVILKHYEIFKSIIRISPERIVIGGIPNYFSIIVILKAIYNYKVYCWWAGHNFSENISFTKRKYREFLAKFIDGCFFYSGYSMNYFQKNIKVLNKNNFRIIGNNTRLVTGYYFNLRNKILNGEKSKTASFNIISVGYQYNKNTITLLKAISHIGINYNIKLNIIGEGPDVNECKEYINKANMKNVMFYGFKNQEEIFNILLENDLFVHPSYFDRWPQVYNEAAMCGIPVLISSKAGVDTNYTRNFKNIVVFDPYNYKDLSNKIIYLLNNHNLLIKLGEYIFYDSSQNDARPVFKKIIELLN